jgi:hypothetical protein
VAGSIVGGALADPVRTLDIHPLGHFPETRVVRLG